MAERRDRPTRWGCRSRGHARRRTGGRRRRRPCSPGCGGWTRRSAPTARAARSAGSTAASSRSRDADPLVREVLARCERLREETGGYFDARAGGRLDPSGLVKGWAVDRAAALLDAPGAQRFCIDAGGDLVARGGPWRVGVRHPRRRRRLAAALSVHDAAVATSGAYERGAHMIDPHTRRPARGALSVTVVGPDSATADAYATAAFAMGAAGPAWTAGLRRLRGDDGARRAGALHARLRPAVRRLGGGQRRLRWSTLDRDVHDARRRPARRHRPARRAGRVVRLLPRRPRRGPRPPGGTPAPPPEPERPAHRAPGARRAPSTASPASAAGRSPRAAPIV